MYRARWAKPALKSFQGLDPNSRERIKAAVAELAVDPRSASNVKALTGPLRGKFRKRVGDLRIIFSIDASCSEVYILTVDWRGSAY